MLHKVKELKNHRLISKVPPLKSVISFISNSPNLRDVKLGGEFANSMTGTSLINVLKAMKNVEVLWIQSSSITEGALKTISTMDNLKELRILFSNCRRR